VRGAREDGVPDGRRHLAGGGGEGLGDEEGVAAGGLPQAVGRARDGAGQDLNGRLRQRPQEEPFRHLQRQVSEHGSQRVPGPGLVVTVGGQQQEAG